MPAGRPRPHQSMKETAKNVDALIIGGGPAGSTMASLLARAGLDVRVFERASFPRPHVGESLLPATLAILEEIGVLPAVAAEGFTKKWGATMCWGKSAEPWSWHFRETNHRYPHAYQVWRPRFDEILLQHSEKCGAVVEQGMAVADVVFEGERATAAVLEDGRRIAAKMIIDASGQASLLANKLRLKIWDSYFRNLAVYGYFRDCEHLDSPDQGNIFIESFAEGWLWKIPLAGGLSSIGAVVDRNVGAKAVREAGLQGFLLSQIAAAPRTAAMVGNRQPVEKPVAVRDWSYAASKMVGPGYVLIGDAACFVDPLFSTGVHLAISAAHIGAAYVVSALTDAVIEGDAADAFERLYRTQYQHFHELARLFYSANRSVDALPESAWFWQTRRITGEQRPPREAFLRAISGQSTAGYERSVLSHGVLPEDFAAAMAAVAPKPVPENVDEACLALAPGLELAKTAVLGDGRFERGQVVRGKNRVDLPLSPLVAQLVGSVSLGEARTVAQIVTEIATQNGLPTERIHPSLLQATRLLLSDGVFLHTPKASDGAR